ncbi:MAG TPA: lysylphosphatidylglycerol synthase transmembrane domain-containing protein [Thermodesulfovibrionales bacterium]|nr:lysylphosphatidylglycerol synthase transmembrane domain-containing protein [Thermodesulfovibrionales bacterium]
MKLTVSSVLLYIVLSRTGPERIFSILKGMSLFAFISAILLYLLAQFISTCRWKLLLPGTLRIKKLFPLYMIGSFFNTILPGLIGGDAVKAFYLYQITGRGSLTLSSIFMDRYLGFVMLTVICTIAFPFGYSYFQNSPAAWMLPFIVLSFIIASLLFFGLRLGKRIKIISEFYDYFHSYRNQKGIIVKALIISAFVQFSSIIAVYILTSGIGEHVPFLACLIFVPLIIMFSALPISISGIGIREGAFVLFFGLIGIRPDAATAISLSWFLANVSGSLLGLIEYIRYRKEK